MTVFSVSNATRSTGIDIDSASLSVQTADTVATPDASTLSLLPFPSTTSSHQADLHSAHRKLDTYSEEATPSTTPSPFVRAEQSMERVMAAAVNTAGMEKLICYKALAKSGLSLTLSMVSTTCAAITVAATPGVAVGVVCTVSGLMLINTLFDVACAQVNVMRLKKSQPPIKTEAFIKTQVIRLLANFQFMQRTVARLERLDTDQLKQLMINYKFVLSTVMTVIPLLTFLPTPDAVKGVWPHTSAIIGILIGSLDVFFPESTAKADTTAIAAISPIDTTKVDAEIEAWVDGNAENQPYALDGDS